MSEVRDQTLRPRRDAWWAAGVVLAAMVFYGLWAGRSIGVISPTIDEPLHAVGAWHARYESDYRPNREDPALFLKFVALFIPRGDLTLDYEAGGGAAESKGGAASSPLYLHKAMYTNAPVPEAIVRHARLAALTLSLALLASVGYMAFRLAGLAGAAVAVTALAMEPLFLGHGILVKNDVAIALVFLWALWGARAVVSNRAGVGPVLGFLAAVAVLPLIKFSGPAMAALAFVPVAIHALRAAPWRLCGMTLRSRGARAAAAGGLLVVAVVASYAMIWATYDFRFLPSRGPTPHNYAGLLELVARSIDKSRDEAGLPHDAVFSPPAPIRFAMWAYEAKFLPESYLTGFTYTYGSTLARKAFLLGEVRVNGWWYYFPVAFGVKTPVTTLLCLAAMLVASAVWLRLRFRTGAEWLKAQAWLVVPLVGYVLISLTSHLNIGLRHFFPVYPLLFLCLAMCAARARSLVSLRTAAITAAVAACALAVEVLPHRHRYIQFFNAPAGGEAGGIKLLGDSNLDWGQCIYLLTDWCQRHPGVPLHATLFGIFDTKFNHMENILLPAARPAATSPSELGYYAISATQLQAIYASPARAKRLRMWADRKPAEVLGGTIYIYDIAENADLLLAPTTQPATTLPATTPPESNAP